jgi:hypothetical protein
MGTMGTNKPEHQFDWEYGGKIHGYGWKKGQRHQYHTHPVMVATLNCCYYYCSLRRAKSVGKGGNHVWGPRAWEIGTEEMDGMRRDWNCHRAGLQYCSRGLLGKKEIWRRQAGREGERDRDYFPFSLCSCARCFFLVYMIVFLFEDPLEWTLCGEKLWRSIHVLALCHSGLKLSFLLRCIWS